MNANRYIGDFIESKITTSEVFAPYIAAGLKIWYNQAGESPTLPYVRYSIQRPAAVGDRDLELRQNVYTVVVNVNIVGNSIEQIRVLSQEITELFDGIISPDGYEYIEDCICTQPEESVAFDSATGKKFFEAVNEITMNYIKE